MPQARKPVLRVKHVWGFFGQWVFGGARLAARQREISQRCRMSDHRRRGSMTYNRQQALRRHELRLAQMSESD